MVDIKGLVLKQYSESKHIDETLGFVILRSNNTNVVNYCIKHENLEVRPYWLMYEKLRNNKSKTLETEDLNFIERNTAYGVKYLEKKKDKTIFSLVGHSKTHFRILNKDNKIIVQVCIDNHYYCIIGLYIHYNSLNLISPVSSIDVYYLDEGKVTSKTFHS